MTKKQIQILRRVYNDIINDDLINDNIKEDFERFFGKELDIKNYPSQEKFNKVFLKLFRKGEKNIRFVNDDASHLILTNEDGYWLFDIKHNIEEKKCEHFIYSFDRVCLRLHDEFNVDSDRIIELIKNAVSDVLGLKGVVPAYSNYH